MDASLFRFVRQSKGLTQEEFAKLLGVSRTYVCLIETGVKPVSYNVRLKLCGLVGDEYIERCRQFLSEK